MREIKLFDLHLFSNKLKKWVKDVNKATKEIDESGNHDYNKHNIFGQYTNSGYTSHKTTTDESSIDTKDTTVNANKKGQTNNSIEQDTREVLINTTINKEIKLPNEIEALSGRKFKGEKLTTYGDEFEPKAKGML